MHQDMWCSSDRASRLEFASCAAWITWDSQQPYADVLFAYPPLLTLPLICSSLFKILFFIPPPFASPVTTTSTTVLPVPWLYLSFTSYPYKGHHSMTTGSSDFPFVTYRLLCSIPEYLNISCPTLFPLPWWLWCIVPEQFAASAIQCNNELSDTAICN